MLIAKGVRSVLIIVKQAAEKWGISDRRVRILCAEGKTPEDAVKPAGGRYKTCS